MNPGQTTALLTLAKDGDQMAFNHLCSRIIPRLLLYIRVQVGSDNGQENEAEDLVQEVLIKAHLKLDTFEKSSSRSFFAWLTSIARNTVCDHWAFWNRASRDRNQTKHEFPELASYYHSALSQMIIDERKTVLYSVLLSLSKEDQGIIMKRHFEELRFVEIAKEMGKTADACRMLFSRAMVRLTKEVVREQAG